MTKVKMTILCLALASCAACGQKPPPAVTTVFREVDRPVPVPCLRPGQKPEQPTRLSEDLPVPPGTLTEMVGRLRAKLKEWQDYYGPTADDLLASCSQLRDIQTRP